jgi:hypothetical protein
MSAGLMVLDELCPVGCPVTSSSIRPIARQFNGFRSFLEGTDLCSRGLGAAQAGRADS